MEGFDAGGRRGGDNADWLSWTFTTTARMSSSEDVGCLSRLGQHKAVLSETGRLHSVANAHGFHSPFEVFCGLRDSKPASRL
jgi:hypothetical protein